MEHVPLVDTDHGIHHRRILADIGLLCHRIGLSCAVQDPGKYFRSKGQGQDRTADSRGGGITAANVIIHVDGFQILRIACQRRGLAGDGCHMLLRIQACSQERILYKCLVGQGLQGRAGLGNNDKDRVGKVYFGKDGRGVIRINVADKPGLHLQGVVHLCPVLECQVERTRAKVRSADTDLDNRGELLAFFIDDLTGMYLVGKLCCLLLLRYIELPLVDAVDNDVISKLAAAQLVQHLSLLSGVDHLAGVQRRIFLDQASLVGEFLQDVHQLIIDLFCSIAVNHAGTHRSLIFLYALCACLSGHSCPDIHRLFVCHFSGCFILIKIQPLHAYTSFCPIGAL